MAEWLIIDTATRLHELKAPPKRSAKSWEGSRGNPPNP
jgi:hypothetical protein